MHKKAQGTIEYMVLLGIIVAALVGMQLYLKRSVQGRMRDYAGQLTGEEDYSPGATLSYLGTNTFISENSSSNKEEDGTTNKQVQTSNQNIIRITNSIEGQLPLADEPVRW